MTPTMWLLEHLLEMLLIFYGVMLLVQLIGPTLFMLDFFFIFNNIKGVGPIG